MSRETEVDVVYRDEDIEVSLEDVGNDETIIIHVEVFTPFTKEKYENWLLLFSDIKQYVQNKGYSYIAAGHDEATPQMIKFWEMFGFVVYRSGDGHMAVITVDPEDYNG